MIGKLAELFIFGLAPLVFASLLLPNTSTAGEITVSGEVFYRERIALPPNAVLTVQLSDVSLADAPASTIAEQKIDPAGQVPIKFEIKFDPAVTQPKASYALQARITVDDQLWFINDQRYAVDPLKPEPQNMLLKKVSQSSEAPPTLFDTTLLAEDIEGRGVIDNAQSTFGVASDRRVTGRGECTLQPDGKAFCEGYIWQNDIPPEDEFDPLPVNELKPTLVNPLVVTLLPSGNPETINANGRDVELRWPSVPVTDGSIEIRGARHIVSIAGHFTPMGKSDNNVGALEFRDQVTGGVAYVERMLIDIAGRRNKDPYVRSDPDAIQGVPATGDAIDFGGVVPYNSKFKASYPSFVMVKSIITGVSGQHPPGCDTCSPAHADGFETVGPFDTLTFKDVHVFSNYQGIFGAPAKNFHGKILDPDEQGGHIILDNVTATVVEPPNLTEAEQVGWRFRATGYYLEAHNLRVEGKQSFFDIDVGPGGMYLDTPTTETQNWLNFIGGKTVLHNAIDANSATIEYTTPPNQILRRGISPNVPTLDEVGPQSAPIFSN